MLKYFILLSYLIVNNAYSRDFLPIPAKFKQIIGTIESNNNDFAIGDNHKALGRYQIWLICYRDCTNYDKTITFSYNSLTNKANSDKIMEVYLNKYGRELLIKNDYESLARLWNGGCNWRNKTGKAKENLDNYVNKFKKAQKNS